MRFRSREELGIPRWVAAVEGTFDDPPIVMWQSRLKLSLICLCLVAVVGVGIIIRTPNRGYLPWPFIFFGAFAATSGLGAVFPTALILTPAGLVFRGALRTVRYEWSDFDRFRVFRIRTRMVGGDFSASYKSRHRWSWSWCVFGGFWDLPPQKIVDVLNEARRRWGPKRTAS
jgi:hypothetical protein